METCRGKALKSQDGGVGGKRGSKLAGTGGAGRWDPQRGRESGSCPPVRVWGVAGCECLQVELRRGLCKAPLDWGGRSPERS